MEKINVGFIGCGRIADLHYPGYKNNPEAKIYAVCDKQKELALQRKSEWGAVKYYTDYREMLRDSDLDAVEILSPHTLHEVMLIDAAMAGKHIMLQKPMTISLHSADRMLEVAEKTDIVLKVTDNYLFYPPIVLAKKMIDQGEIGVPLNLRIKMISGGSGGWDVPSSAWEWRMAEKEAGRGMQTFDHGHHLWATAWFLMGDIERVTAWIDSADGIVDSPAVVMWKYKDDVKYGMCEYTHAADMNIPSKYYANDEWMEITGSKGIIVIHRCTGNIKDGPGVSMFKDGVWKYYPDVKTDWGEGFINSTLNFIESIHGKAKPLLSGGQAREILKLNLAISKSSRIRREVYVDEMDSSFPWLFSLRKIRQEKRENSQKKSLLTRLKIGTGDSRYASQARFLTENLINRFDSAEAVGWETDIGFHLLEQGNMPETYYHLSIKNGKAVITEGKLPEEALLTLRVRAGTWSAILLGKKRIETALIQGKLKLEGKAELGLKLRKVFDL